MRKEEFKAYAATLRAKTNTFKNLKLNLADLRQETVVLARTEQVCALLQLQVNRLKAYGVLQILKGRAGDADAFLRQLEAKAGVTGYTAVQSDLEQVHTPFA
jgi:hypothetical protein